MAVGGFVGRRAELVDLAAAMSGAGPHRVVLITGDAGIGKSRLVAEATAAARRDGAVVLTAGCLPLTASMPLLPVTEALHQLLEPANQGVFAAARETLPAAVGDRVAALVPALGAPGRTSLASTATDQPLLLAAVRDLLDAVGGRRHVALVIEDLHWADPSSLDALTYLTRTSGPGVTVVVNSRADEPGDGQQSIGDWLAATARLPGCLILQLRPLDEVATAELVHVLAPAASRDRGFLAEVRRRGEGNPFFTEQLVADAMSADTPSTAAGQVPDGVAVLLATRVRTVPDTVRPVLEVLAVAGRPLTEVELFSTIPERPEPLEVAVKALIDQRLAVRGGDDRYGLRHALLGDVVVSEMMPSRRRARHAAVAETLADVGAEPGEVAAHWAAAGDADEELVWSAAAARDAERVFAWPAAAALWERVDALWDTVRMDTLAGLQRGEAVVRLVECLWSAGAESAAGVVVREALASGRYDDEPWTKGRLLFRYSFETGGTVDTARSVLEEAAWLLRGLPPSDALSAVLARLSRLVGAYDNPVVDSYLNEALLVAQAAGAESQVREITGTVASQMLADGDAQGALQLIETTLAEARSAGDGEGVQRLGVLLTDGLTRMGRLSRAATEGRRLVVEARAFGLDQTFGAGLTLGNTLEALLLLGHTGEARALLDDYESGREPGSPLWPHAICHVEVEIAEGRFAAAGERLLAMSEDVKPPGSEYALWTSTRSVEVALWEGDAAGAARLGPETLSAIVSSSLRTELGQLLWLTARASADLGDHGMGEQLRELAVASGALVPHPARGLSEAWASSVEAELQRATGRPATAAWADAALEWERLGCAHLEGYARWRLAEDLLSVRRRTEAEQELQRAAELSAEQVPQSREIAALARRAQIDLDTPTAAPAATAVPLGLTERELSVLRLLTLGRTNSQIGSALYMSPKTASVHVSSILRKPGVSSRVQAATIAERAGLGVADD